MKKLPAQILSTSITASIMLTTFATLTFAQTENTTTTPTPTTAVVKITPAESTLMQRKTQISGAPIRKQLFMEKLALIKDAQKKTLVEKIDTKVGDINQKRTTQMSQSLMLMNKILTELSTKSVVAKEQGQDTVKLNLAIASAQAAVKSAEDAVTNQTAKEYTVSITTESALKTTVGTSVRTLQTDLRNTHAAVANAKQKVILAVGEFVKLKRDNKNASGSAMEK